MGSKGMLLGSGLGGRSLGGHLGLGDLLLAGTGEAGIGEELAHELDRGDGVVVAGDAVIDHVGIGVGVDEGDHGDAEALGLLDGVLLALGVDDEKGGRGALELTGATEVGLQLGELLTQDSLLLLAAQGHGAVGDHALELLEAVDAGADGHEVGEHAAEPALVDVRHVGALGGGLHGLLSLLLGADEEDLATLGSGLLQEGVSLVGLDDGLLEVEDVDVVALTEDERLHLGVPTTGLVTEVAASLEQGTDVNLGSHVYLPVFLSHGVDHSDHSSLCYLSPSTAAGV